MTNRVNKTYLNERVQAVRAQRSQEISEQASKELAEVRKAHLKTLNTGHLVKKLAKLQKAKEAARTKLEAAKMAVVDFEDEVSKEYPYLFINDIGDFGYRQLNRYYGNEYYVHDSLPKVVRDKFNAIRDEVDRRNKGLREMSTTFTDKVMMGDATYEDFAALMQQLSDI